MFDAHVHARGSGVLVDVQQRFLDDAEQGDLG